MARIRWGVMGAGGIARRRTIPEGILPAANAELVAVYSPHSGQEVAAQFGVPAARTEAALFDYDFDAVYIASPVNCHRRQVELAAASGRHVLCEKPLGLSAADVEPMLAACEQAGVTLGVGTMMRHHPHHRRAAELVQRGDLGGISYVRAQLSYSYPPQAGAWRQDPAQGGGGPLPDLAPHCLDLLEMIVGSPISSVTCRLANRVHQYAVEDTAIILLEFASGVIGTVDCLFCTPDECVRNRLEVYGSQGSLLADGTLGQLQAGTLEWLQAGSTSGPTIQPLPPGNLYRAQIDDFSQAILDRRAPVSTGAQGLWIQRLLDACQQSSAERTTQYFS